MPPLPAALPQPARGSAACGALAVRGTGLAWPAVPPLSSALPGAEAGSGRSGAGRSPPAARREGGGAPRRGPGAVAAHPRQSRPGPAVAAGAGSARLGTGRWRGCGRVPFSPSLRRDPSAGSLVGPAPCGRCCAPWWRAVAARRSLRPASAPRRATETPRRGPRLRAARLCPAASRLRAWPGSGGCPRDVPPAGAWLWAPQAPGPQRCLRAAARAWLSPDACFQRSSVLFLVPRVHTAG